MSTLVNSFEGITPSGTAVTTGNSGGTSGNAFDGITNPTGTTLASDSTHAAHGTLGLKVATGTTAQSSFVNWKGSIGSQSTIWFRCYAYFTANPATQTDLFAGISGSNLGAGIVVNTSGTISAIDSNKTVILTSTTTIPLNTWFRVEGFLVGNASIGRMEFQIFTTKDAIAPAEIQTSTATQNTIGVFDSYRFGQWTNAANIGPYWLDDVAISNHAYIGPFPNSTSWRLGDNCNGVYGSPYSAAWAQWELVTGRHLAVQRKYWTPTETLDLPAPSNPPPPVPPQLLDAAARGTHLFMGFEPPHADDPAAPGVRVALGQLLASAKAAGVQGVVTLQHEPDTPSAGLTLAQWQAIVPFYGPTIRQYYPLYYGQVSEALLPKVGQTQPDYVTWFLPGQFDGCYVDFYCAGFVRGQPFSVAENLADQYGLPLGIGEYGCDQNAQTVAQIQGYYQFFTSTFAARQAAGKPPAYICHFTANPATNLSQPQFETFTAPGMPGSGVQITSPFTFAVAAVITGGSVTNVVVNGTSVGTGPGTYVIPGSATITLTYGSAPTWSWVQYEIPLYQVYYDTLAAAPGAQPLTITTTSPLPNATNGVAYSFQNTASGGTNSGQTWTLNSGSLPTGMTISSAGLISGTCSTNGTSTFTLKVTDSGSNTAISGPLTLTVGAGTLAVTTGALAGGTQGTAYSATETNSGGVSPFAWVLFSGALPPGITLSSAGALSGTPTTLGTFQFKVQVTDANSNTAVSSTQTITIGPPGGVAVAISAIGIDVSSVSQTGHDKAVAAHGVSTAPSVASGTLSQAEEQAIAFIADATIGGNPTWAGGWTSLGNQADGGSHLILSAAYQTTTATTSLTASGTIASAAWSAAVITYAVNPPNLTTILSNGVEGDPYSQTLETTGGLGTIGYAITGGTLPPGLTLAGSVISGTPTTAGIYTFTLVATDAHGFADNQPENVTIVVVGASPATAQPMPGNRLTQADSDFESGVGSWIAQTNATGVTTSVNAALTGSKSLRWASTADGSTSVKTGVYTGIQAGKPYIVSGYILATSNQSPNLWIGINWYTSSGTFISTTSNGGVPLVNPLQWQGVSAALTAPANAAKAEVFVQVDLSNAGDMNYLDLAFMTQSAAQVLIDFVNPAFGTSSVAGDSFADVSPWLRLDQAITYQRGRQDSISEVTTGQASFQLQNDGGFFTRGNQDSIAVVMGGQVTLGCRCQINLADETGAWHTRFDGQLSQITYAIDPVGNTSLATVGVSDILAALNRQASPTFPGSPNSQGALSALSCWTKEQVLQNGPTYHWSLNDTPNPSGTFHTIAAETSGNSGPPLKLVRSALATGAKIAWADTTGGVETLADAFAPGEPDGSEFWTAGQRLPINPLRGLDSGAVGPFTTPMQSVYFTPVLNAASAQNAFVSNTGYMFQAVLPTPLAPSVSPGADFSVEAWFTVDPAVVASVTDNYGPYTVFSLGSSRRGTSTVVAGVFQPSKGIIPAAGAALYAAGPAYGALNFPTSVPLVPIGTATSMTAFPEADTVQRPHHLVLTVQGDPIGPLCTAYVDGNQVGNFVLAPGTTFDTITVGGSYGKTGCFFGNISMVSVYPYVMTPGQIVFDCQLGQYGMWEAPTDDCVAQLANYANLPAFWNNTSPLHNGCSLTDYFDITSSNPYAAMTTFEQTENGLLFVNALGQLTFHTRDWRMGYGAPKLTLPPDSYNAALSPSVVDSYQTNQDAIASVAFPGGAAYINEASQAQYGTYATNPIGSPAQLAHISFSRAYGSAGIQEQAFWPDPNMLDAAAWAANSHADPWYVLGSVTVDMLAVDPTWGVNISNFYAVEIDDVLNLGSTLPGSFPTGTHNNEYFIEGIGETYQIDINGNSQRNIVYYVSPASTQRAWVPGDANYGVLGSTTRIGISAADTSTPQADGKDVSHDGGPPYWAPAFATNMNSPANQSGGGFVGMNDIRGLIWPLQQLLQPAMAATSTLNNTQTIPTGQLTGPQTYFDTLQVDSANGMGIMPGWPNWYVCLVPGFYEIDGGVPYASTSTAGGAGLQGWIVVSMNTAQQVVAGTGSPDASGAYVCPVGETVRQNSVGMNSVASASTRMYLGLGDMVGFASEQDTGSTTSTSTVSGGPHLSVRFVGLATADDRVQINTTINGGQVTNPVPITHATKTYSNQHSYAHYGFGANRGQWTLNTKDTSLYQGVWNSNLETVGSQYGLVRFNWAQMQADLVGKTLTSVTLTCTNLQATYNTAQLIGGYYYTNNEGSTWHPNAQTPPPSTALWTQWFKAGQTLKFEIPASQFQQFFVKNMAHGIMIGDDGTKKGINASRWQGIPGSWTLTVSY